MDIARNIPSAVSPYPRTSLAGSSLAAWGGIAFAFASAVVYLLNTRYGIGIRPDSLRYMHNSWLPADAPMYGWVLELASSSGLNIVAGAKLTGLVLVSANAFLVWHILLKATNRPAYAVGGTALILLAPTFVGMHAMALSEPLFLFSLFLTVLCFLNYLETRAVRWLVLASMGVAFAALVRFPGATLGAALAGLLLALPDEQPRTRITRTALLAGISGALFGGWALFAKLTTGQAVGRELHFYGNADDGRWLQGFDSLSSLIVPMQVPAVPRGIFLFAVIAGALWLCVRHWQWVLRPAEERKRRSHEMAGPILLTFALCYFAFIMLALGIEANLPLNGRYALPFYVGLMMASTIALARLPSGSGVPAIIEGALIAAAMLILAFHAVRTTVQTHEYHSEGIDFASRAWAGSPTIAAIRRLPGDAIIYSNGPEPITYLTERSVQITPRRISARTGRDMPENPFAAQVDRVRRDLASGKAYVVFLDRVDWRFYLATEAELRRMLPLVLIERTSDGRIYAAAPDTVEG